MKIVVLAGGTSTERDVSIVSGTGICNGLRAKGQRAVLVDVFCGVENVDWEDPFPAEYDVEAAAEYMKSFNPEIEKMKKRAERVFRSQCHGALPTGGYCIPGPSRSQRRGRKSTGGL